MPLSRSPDAFKLRTLFMGSLGEIPESHFIPVNGALEPDPRSRFWAYPFASGNFPTV